jgi:CBS domain-containing protein
MYRVNHQCQNCGRAHARGLYPSHGDAGDVQGRRRALVGVIAPWRAADVMDLECEFVPADCTVSELLAHPSSGAPAHLLGTASQLVGVVSRGRLASAVEAGLLSEPLASLVDARLVHGHADHPTDVILDRLARSHGVLPIVSREDATRMVGVITVDHIWRFEHRRRETRLPTLLQSDNRARE